MNCKIIIQYLKKQCKKQQRQNDFKRIVIFVSNFIFRALFNYSVINCFKQQHTISEGKQARNQYEHVVFPRMFQTSKFYFRKQIILYIYSFLFHKRASKKNCFSLGTPYLNIILQCALSRYTSTCKCQLQYSCEHYSSQCCMYVKMC